VFLFRWCVLLKAYKESLRFLGCECKLAIYSVHHLKCSSLKKVDCALHLNCALHALRSNKCWVAVTFIHTCACVKYVIQVHRGIDRSSSHKSSLLLEVRSPV
jgi:hypothetical protein